MPMCTAITFKNRYFGRTLDMESSLGERVVVMPRRFAYALADGETLREHYAVIGMAAVQKEQPLFYDGINECGLFAAALEFPESGAYLKGAGAKNPIASFDVIPKILATAENVKEAEMILWDAVITEASVSEEMPSVPLHWIIADGERCIVAEPLQTGLKIHENSVGVLTNEPPFEFHMANLAGYMKLSPEPPVNEIAPQANIRPLSKGMGAAGLPGDWSSASRFVRAVYGKNHSSCCEDSGDCVEQFFRMMSTVAQVRGLVHTKNAKDIRTIYTSCMSSDGVYYYSTYEDGAIRAVDMRKTDMGGRELTEFALERRGIILQNL